MRIRREHVHFWHLHKGDHGYVVLREETLASRSPGDSFSGKEIFSYVRDAESAAWAIKMSPRLSLWAYPVSQRLGEVLSRCKGRDPFLEGGDYDSITWTIFNGTADLDTPMNPREILILDKFESVTFGGASAESWQMFMALAEAMPGEIARTTALAVERSEPLKPHHRIRLSRKDYNSGKVYNLSRLIPVDYNEEALRDAMRDLAEEWRRVEEPR